MKEMRKKHAKGRRRLLIASSDESSSSDDDNYTPKRRVDDNDQGEGDGSLGQRTARPRICVDRRSDETDRNAEIIKLLADPQERLCCLM